MQKIQLSIIVLTCCSNFLFAVGDTLPPIEKDVKDKTVVPQTVQAKSNGYSVYFLGGASFLNPSTNLSSDEEKSGTLDKNGNVFELGLGKKFNKNIFSTLSVQRVGFELGKLNSISASVNYQFFDKKMKPYIGVLLGYSKLDWDSRPFARPRFSEDLSSSSLMYGLQVGIEYPFKEHLSLLAMYQFEGYDHKLEIDNGAYHVTHDYSQNLLVGVKYGF